MRGLWVIVLLFCLPVRAQVCSAPVNSIFIDTCRINPHVRKIPKGYKSIKKLRERILNTCTTDQEKVYFIYMYIATHFVYDLSRAEAIGKNKIKRELYTKELLSRRKGVCGDFANYFKLLCDTVDIKCLKVYGYAEGGLFFDTPKDNVLDHSWNVVAVNNRWYYIDVTWSISEGTKPFETAQISMAYLFADEHSFSGTHLPSDPIYQLSTYKKTFGEFRWKNKAVREVHDPEVDSLLNQRYQLDERALAFAELDGELSFVEHPEIELFSRMMRKIGGMTDKTNPAHRRIKIEDYEEAISWYSELSPYASKLKKRDQEKMEHAIEQETEKLVKKLEKLQKKTKEEE